MFHQQGATVPSVGLERPGGTVFPQLRSRAYGEGKRFALKGLSWQAGLYTAGVSMSAQSIVTRAPVYNIHMASVQTSATGHEPWMSSRYLEAWLLARLL